VIVILGNCGSYFLTQYPSVYRITTELSFLGITDQEKQDLKRGLTTMQSKNLISVIELRRLLHDLKDRRPDICVRFRMLGEMWSRNFMSIAAITGKGVMLKDDQDSSLVVLNDLTNVMQFELDNSFTGFQAHFHYEVKPIPEFDEVA
jgi:hypothetical protein